MSDDPQWLAWRLGGITASDVAIAMTGKYGGGPVSVIAKKLGLITPEITPEMQARFDRGHALEARIATAAEALHGIYIVGEQTWCTHAEYPWARCTVDGFTADEPAPAIDDVTGVAEIKTRLIGVNRPTDYYTAQTHWQMFVTATERALLAEAIIDHSGDIVRLTLEVIHFDPNYFEKVWTMAQTLWSYLEVGKVPPASIGNDLTAVKALTAKADTDADPVDLSDMADELARRAELKARVKDDEAEIDLISARIIQRMGDATKGTAPGFKASYSAPKRVVTDEAAAKLVAAHPKFGAVTLDRSRVKAEAPELYEAARQAVGARALTITTTK